MKLIEVGGVFSMNTSTESMLMKLRNTNGGTCLMKEQAKQKKNWCGSYIC